MQRHWKCCYSLRKDQHCYLVSIPNLPQWPAGVWNHDNLSFLRDFNVFQCFCEAHQSFEMCFKVFHCFDKVGLWNAFPLGFNVSYRYVMRNSRGISNTKLPVDYMLKL